MLDKTLTQAIPVSGTTLTLSAATASTNTMYCVFLGRAIGTVGIAAGSVTKDKVDFISDSSRIRCYI